MRVSVWYLLYALLCAVSLINAATLPTANAHAKALHVEDRTARAAAKLIYTQHAKKQSFVAKAAAGDVKGVGGALFPIAKHELKKFFMMSGMMFFIIYVYTVVRDTKDTLVVSHCGAEAITFLKVYGVLPAAALFMVVYAKISNIFSKRKLFYVTAFPFFAFYALFCFVLYPFRHFLQPAEFGGSEGIGFLFKIIQHWTFSLYYIVSELFGSVGVSVLFWQLANDIVPVEQARRFYPLFGQLANLAPIAAGQTVVLSAKMNNVDAADSFMGTIKLVTFFIMLSGAGIFGLYHNIMNLRDQELAEIEHASTVQKKPKKSKPKMSMTQSFKFLASSPYLGFLAVLVISYGLSINFTEVMWKSQVKKMYPDKNAYQQFMGNYSTALGATTFFIIFFGSNIVKLLGWKVGALITPVLMGILAAPFFAFIIFGLKAGDPKMAIRTAVLVGLIQNIFSKSVKYALFDPTKEMAYIPLDQESKIKGKAAIDVLAARIGKSGGALLQQVIVLYFGNVISGAPAIAAMFYVVLGAWIVAAYRLGDLFAAKLKERDVGGLE